MASFAKVTRIPVAETQAGKGSMVWIIPRVSAASPSVSMEGLRTNSSRNNVLPEWRGWHAFRRGLATNLNRLGVDDSVIQRILRHSNVAVTQACYIKTAREDAKAAMQKLETALNDTYVTPRQLTMSTKTVM